MIIYCLQNSLIQVGLVGGGGEFFFINPLYLCLWQTVKAQMNHLIEVW